MISTARLKRLATKGQDEAQRERAASQVAVLFETYSGPITAYLYRLLGDWNAASDLTQEAFLRAFRAREQLLHVENQRAWLYRIATNAAFDTLRRRRLVAWLPWGGVQAHFRSVPHDGEHIEMRSDVERALAELSPEYRAPLLLYSYYGFSVREVAQALGISEGAVKNRLYRARERFRQVYEREGA